MKQIRFVIYFGILLGFVGCTGNPPVIEDFTGEYLYSVEGSNITLTHLSVSLLVSDPDGFEDIEEISVYHPGRQVFWQIPVDEMFFEVKNDEHFLILPLLGYLPFGQNPILQIPGGNYELTLSDLAGESDTFRFTVSPLHQTDLKNLPLPTTIGTTDFLATRIEPEIAEVWKLANNKIIQRTDASEYFMDTDADLNGTYQFFLVQKSGIQGIWVYSRLSD